MKRHFILILLILILVSQVNSNPFEFTIIKTSRETYLQINSNVLPCQTAVLEELNKFPVSANDSLKGLAYDLHLMLNIINDSINCNKQVYRERFITILDSNQSGIFWICPIRQIFLSYQDSLFTITDFNIIDNSVKLVMCPAVYIPPCSVAVIQDHNVLLNLLVNKAINSKIICIVDTVDRLFDTTYLFNDSIPGNYYYREFPSYSIFNRHDIITEERLSLNVLDKLKGDFLGSLISFLSGINYYNYLSSNNNNPVFHRDSIKTSGENIALIGQSDSWKGVIKVAPYSKWIVFSDNDSFDVSENPGFPSYSQCPPPPCPSYITVSRFTPSSIYISNVVPIGNDTIWLNESTKMPLRDFLDAINQPKVERMPAFNNIQIHTFPNPLTPTTSISYNLGPGSTGSMKICDIRGKIVFERAIQSTGMAVWDATGLGSGVYILKAVSVGRKYSRKLVLQR